MCGIAGILRYGRGVSIEEIDRMAKALSHRGPDHRAFLIKPPVAIANTRLAIIDLESGNQPISTADGARWITYNGEIYNFEQLRCELEHLGHRFSTRSDTEVVLRAHAEWGASCLERLRGMFAFAIIDFDRRALFLARDPFGIKPLYYRAGEGFLAFASELNALLQIDEPTPRGSLRSIDEYLRFRYIPAPRTIYGDTMKLPPASFLKVSFDGVISPPERYWDLTFRPVEGQPEAEWMESASEVIRGSVKAHLMADVPVGVFLSGGIDSAVIASFVSEFAPGTKAFFLGFDGREAREELDRAKEVAAAFDLDLRFDLVGEEGVEILPSLVEACGEPFGDSSLVPTWHLSKFARDEVKVVLSGDGGDEFFAGYDSYTTWLDGNRVASLLRALIENPRTSASRLLRDYLRHNGSARLIAWQRQVTFFNERARRSLWRPEFRHVAVGESPLFAEAAARAAEKDRLSFAQYLDYRTYLPFDILTKVDAASMQHGLEVRTPLVDRVVAQFAAKLPVAMRHGWFEGRRIPKYVLKRLLLDSSLSRELVDRPKVGFDLHRRDLFLPGGRFHDLLRQLLSDGEARLPRLFVSEGARAHLDVHRHVEDNSGVLWLLLVLGLWLEQHRRMDFE